MTTETAIQIQVSRHQQTLEDTSRHQQTDSDLDSIRNSRDVFYTIQRQYNYREYIFGQLTNLDPAGLNSVTEGWWNLGGDLQTSKYPLPPINIFDSSKLCSEFVQMFIFISCKYSPTARGEGISFKRFTSHQLCDIYFTSIHGVMICPLLYELYDSIPKNIQKF